MKTNRLRVILLTLLTISSAAVLAPQMAWAQQCNIEKDQCVPFETDSDGDYNGSNLCDKKTCSQSVVSANNHLQANGVLEGPEQCDDGRPPSSSFCNGNFFKANEFRNIELEYKPECNNGVIDPGETCDSLEQGVCSSCKVEPPEKFQNRTCFRAPLCGNGTVEAFLGEQCDDGNREDGDGCSSICTTEKTDTTKMIFQVPRFSLTEDSVLFWEYDDSLDDKDDNIMDGRRFPLGNPTKAITFKTGPIINGSPPISPLNREKSKVVLSNRGQVVTIQHDAGKQHSGVLLSNRTYDFEKNPNDVVDFHVVFSVPEGSGEKKPWDDDAFGFVFGANPGDATTNTDADYWMLNWRGYKQQGTQGNYTSVKPKGRDSKCKEPVLGGGENLKNSGLNLFEIKGIPEWNELWQMEGCGTDLIQKIETYYNGNKPVWNMISNPLHNLDTRYTWKGTALDPNNWQLLNAGQPKRSQMRVKLTKDFFKVWVNSFLTIHITRKDFPVEYKWPSKGQWGFFFIGMDNLKADFQSYNARINNYDDSFEPNREEGNFTEPEAIQCNVCGDGYLYDDEQCDDGNTKDGDGCSKDCKVEAGYACTKAEGVRTECIQAAITSPTTNGSVKVDDLNISGTYSGTKPHDVTVTIYDNDGKKLCSGKGTISDNNTWSFDKDQCKDSNDKTVALSGNNKYKIEAVFSPDENTKDEDKFVTSVGPVNIDATNGGGGTNNNPGGTNNNPGGGTNNNPGGNTPIDVGGGTITPTEPYVVHIDYTGEPGTDITVTFRDKNGREKVVSGKFDANGKFERDVVLKDEKDVPLENPFTITVKTTKNGAENTEVTENVNLLYNMEGSLVAGGCGGCSSTDTSSGGLIALLLAALGLVGIRRRSSHSEEKVA